MIITEERLRSIIRESIKEMHIRQLQESRGYTEFDRALLNEGAIGDLINKYGREAALLMMLQTGFGIGGAQAQELTDQALNNSPGVEAPADNTDQVESTQTAISTI